MFTLLLAALAPHALADGVTVLDSAAPPAVPSSLPIYAAAATQPLDMEALRGAFGLEGELSNEALFGGLESLTDGERHAYVYDLGGVAVHDLEAMLSDAPMTPRSDEEVLEDAAALLGALGLDAVGPAALDAGRVGARTLARSDAEGELLESRTTHQGAFFEQVIGGYPGFGGGAGVEVIFDGEGAVAALSAPMRALDEAGEAALIGPGDAVASYAARVESTGRVSLAKVAIPGLNEVEITGITLGYLVPDLGSTVTAVEPVYQLTGVIRGVDEGETVEGELVWYEPAAAGRALPDLGVD